MAVKYMSVHHFSPDLTFKVPGTYSNKKNGVLKTPQANQRFFPKHLTKMKQNFLLSFHLKQNQEQLLLLLWPDTYGIRVSCRKTQTNKPPSLLTPHSHPPGSTTNTSRAPGPTHWRSITTSWWLSFSVCVFLPSFGFLSVFPVLNCSQMGYLRKTYATPHWDPVRLP